MSRSPAEGLALAGIDAATVKDVVITHLHYDHAGCMDSFPAATFHLQDAEMSFAHRALHVPQRAAHPDGGGRRAAGGAVRLCRPGALP
ncbi:MAG: MBL fold metallo-hydrolase [Acetobacteraceae bacterium]